eukprot:COSAG06_NODE_5190_length_3648_cov_3.167371_9_plen_157_part_00
MVPDRDRRRSRLRHGLQHLPARRRVRCGGNVFFAFLATPFCAKDRRRFAKTGFGQTQRKEKLNTEKVKAESKGVEGGGVFFSAGERVTVTTDGTSDGRIRNGIADWVYEEEILSGSNELFFSPNNQVRAPSMHSFVPAYAHAHVMFTSCLRYARGN